MTLAQELAEVTRLVDADDVTPALDRFVARAVRLIPGCDHASITVRSRGVIEVVAGPTRRDLDGVAVGPVVEALTFTEPRRLGDVATDQRWPAFSEQMAHAGYASCIALPLPTQADEPAVFTLYSSTPEQFGDSSFDLVLLLALHAGTVFDNAELYYDSQRIVAQLRTALGTRSVVGQAQGLLMHRHGYDTEHAFSALKRASQNSNTKLRDLAALIVASHENGELDSTLDKLALAAAGEPTA